MATLNKLSFELKHKLDRIAGAKDYPRSLGIFTEETKVDVISIKSHMADVEKHLERIEKGLIKDEHIVEGTLTHVRRQLKLCDKLVKIVKKNAKV